jgi:aspartate racemase
MAEKTIGILGGMGPEATADLFYRIIRATPVKRDQDHFHIIIDSNAKIPDRTPAILGTGPSPLPLMIETGQRLEAMGASFLIMPCNTAHFFYDKLQKAFGIPLLHMVRLSAEYVSDKYIKVKKIGLLATDGTIASELYDRAYKEYGMDTIVPIKSLQRDVMEAIYIHIKTGDLEKGRELLHKVAYELIDAGADVVICGCTEVSLVLHNGDLRVPVVDPLQVLAEESVKLASK